MLTNKPVGRLSFEFRTELWSKAAGCLIFLVGCVTTPTATTISQKSSEQNPNPRFEAATCSLKFCGRGVSIVGLNPSRDDMLSHTDGEDSSNLVLDDLQNGDEVDGAESDDNLDEAAAINGVLRSLLFSDKSSATVDSGLTALFLGLSSYLKTDGTGLNIPNVNISAKNAAERSKIVSILTEKMDASKIPSSSPTSPPGLERSRLLVALTALRDLSGEDGWLNLGDLPRMLPVISNVVSRPLAEGSRDEDLENSDSATGYAEAVALYSEKNPSSSRHWVLRADNILGRQISKSLVTGLEKTYGKHWSDVVAASTIFQSTFRGLMEKLGTKSYNLNAPGKLKYYDTAAIIEGAQVDRLAMALCGKTVHELTALSKSKTASEASTSREDSSALPCVHPFRLSDAITQNVELPDGLPVRDIELLFKVTAPTESQKFPPNIVFSISSGGKLMISKLTTTKASL